MQIYILTRGRVNKQITLESIPRALLKDTYLVCAKDEAEKHRKLGRQCKVVPKNIDNYSKKFQYLLWGKADKSCRQFVMMDDDLFFHRRDPKSEKLFATTDRDRLKMFDWLKRMRGMFPLSGVHPRQMGHNKELPYVNNGRILCVHNINLDLFPAWFKVDHYPILADKILNCELLSQGIPNAILTAYTVDWGSVQAPGGCSDYRTLDMQKEAVHGVADMYAPFAKAVVKKPKTAKWLGDERWDLRIQWKRLYQHGVENSA